MSNQKNELVIGDTWVFEVVVKNSDNTEITNLSNYTIRIGCQNGENIIKKIFLPGEFQVVSLTNIILRIEEAQTKLAQIGKYNYEVEIISPDGKDKFTILRDNFSIVDEIIKNWD